VTPDQPSEIVGAAFTRSATEGWDALFELLDADIEWEVRPDLPDADVYRGHEGVRRLLGRFDEVMEDIWFVAEEVIPAGADRVVVQLRWGGRGKGSGVEFEETRETWLFTVRAGKIVRVKEFATRAEALEALGLSE
jgi:ketosteroid isomerase-like protein